MWPTVFLVGTATLISAVAGILVGIRSGWKRDSSFDRGSTSVSMFTYAMPDFYLGILLLAVFAFWLAWLPTGGLESPGCQRANSHTARNARGERDRFVPG